MPEINSSVFTVLAGKLAMEAMNSKIIVVEDKFKTGYECKSCDGVGFLLNEACPLCKDTPGFEAEGTPCRLCNRKTNAVQSVCPGKKQCPDCKGRGATIVVPQNTERRPTTGKVVSCGPMVTQYETNDHILYGNYSGHAIDYKQARLTIRILDEKEVLTKLYKLSDKINEAEMGEVKID